MYDRLIPPERIHPWGDEDLLEATEQDRTRIVPIGALRPGQDAVVEGTVAGADVVMGRRRSLLVRLQDGSGTLSLRFYHFSQAQKDGLKRGTLVRCYGEVRPGSSGLEIYHPEYRALSGGEPSAVEQTLTPIYPTTEGLTQQRLRQLSEQALARLGLQRRHGFFVADKPPQRGTQVACVQHTQNRLSFSVLVQEGDLPLEDRPEVCVLHPLKVTQAGRAGDMHDGLANILKGLCLGGAVLR